MPTKFSPKIPPQDLEAERSVLGALMIEQHAIIKITDILTPEDFYHPQHRIIFDAILDLFEHHEPIDPVTVTQKLKAKKKLKEIGGAEYLTELMQGVPTAAHVEHYATMVKEKRVRRDLLRASSEINENAFDSEDFEELLDGVEQKIFSISQRSRPQRFAPIKQELNAAAERLGKLHHGKGERGGLRGVPSFFPKLDSLLSGFQKSDMIIVGARPSVGKTSFALDIAREVGMHNLTVGLFSLEMSKDQVVDRLIASQAQVSLWRMRSGQLRDEIEFQAVQQSLDRLSKAKIFIDDTPSMNIMQIRSMARRLQIEHGLDIIIIDYLQLIQPRTNSDNIVQQITEISRNIKALARELQVPVLILSQLSREMERREVKIPKLSDLRDSGSLEQDADVVIFLARKESQDSMQGLPDEQNLTNIIIAKHRNGPTGAMELRFQSEYASFRTIDTVHTPAEAAGVELP